MSFVNGRESWCFAYRVVADRQVRQQSTGASIAPAATVRQPGETRLHCPDWVQRQRHGVAVQCQPPPEVPPNLAHPLDAALLPAQGTGVSRIRVNLHERAIERV